MYKHQPTNKRSFTPRVSLTFLNSRVKSTIQSMFYKEKNYGWNYSNRKIAIADIFGLIGLPAIFNVESESKDKINKLVVGRFDKTENEIILVVGSVHPQSAEQVSRTEEKEDILRLLDTMQVGERIRISIRNDMKRIRRDAPDRVFKIYNLKKHDDNTVALLSEYDFTRATYAIDEVKAKELAKRLLEDENHEIHEFIRTNTFTKVESLEKLFEETLTNWNRVY